VKATIDYALDPRTRPTTVGVLWGPVKEVQAVDDYTVRFVTAKPWPT